jgi:hypothetical protein
LEEVGVLEASTAPAMLLQVMVMVGVVLAEILVPASLAVLVPQVSSLLNGKDIK